MFTLEAHISQGNYWAYISVTSTLFAFVAVALGKLVLRPQSRIEIVLAWLFGLAYLLASGVLFASAMGFMLKWALAPLWAVVAVHFYARGRTRLGKLL